MINDTSPLFALKCQRLAQRSEPDTFAIVLVDVWKGVGLAMVINGRDRVELADTMWPRPSMAPRLQNLELPCRWSGGDMTVIILS